MIADSTRTQTRPIHWLSPLRRPHLTGRSTRPPWTPGWTTNLAATLLTFGTPLPLTQDLRQLMTMRFNGTIKSWNDERGFGFIEPSQGGQDIFVHIKAFNDLRERPQINQRVSYQLEIGPQGKMRAIHAELLPAKRTTPAPVRQSGPVPWGTATVSAVPAFGVVLLLGYVLGHPPHWLPWVYLGISILTFLAYASDKSAAQQGSWRISEKTLHLLALIGGWPGALLAQQMLRHKSSKQAFRSVFWVTVALNVVGFMYLASPWG